MSHPGSLLVFSLEGQRYALPLGAVGRVVRAAEITPLPRAPRIVMGVIDVAGEVLPVLNVRRRFQMPERPVDVTDQFLVATAGKRKVALAIDQAHGLIDAAPEEWVETAAVMPGLEQVQGVLKRDDGLVLIHDLERFLSLEEAAALEAALDPEAADA